MKLFRCCCCSRCHKQHGRYPLVVACNGESCQLCCKSCAAQLPLSLKVSKSLACTCNTLCCVESMHGAAKALYAVAKLPLAKLCVAATFVTEPVALYHVQVEMHCTHIATDVQPSSRQHSPLALPTWPTHRVLAVTYSWRH